MEGDLGRGQRVLGDHPALGRGELDEVDVARIGGAAVDALADAVGTEHIVAVAREAVGHDRLRRGEPGIERAIEERAQPYLQVAVAPQVHHVLVAVDVLDRGALRAHVGDHGQAEASGEVHRLGGATLPVGIGLHRLQRRKRLARVERRRSGGVDRHRHAVVLEESSPKRIRHRATGAGRGEIHRMVRRRRVELGEGRQALFRQAVDVPAANAGDELAGRHVELANARDDHLLQLAHRRRSLDNAYLVTGVLAAADEMHVRVDEAWNDGRALQVDGAAARPERSAASDLDDAPVADAYRRDHAVVRIERQKAAVDEVEIARAFAFRIVPPRIVLPRRPRCPREQRSARCHRRRGLHEPAARQAPLLQIFTRHWRSSLMCR